MKIAFSAACLLVLVTISFAQSGRRITPAPTPAPAVISSQGGSDDDAGYSESRPNHSRRLTRAERYPGMNDPGPTTAPGASTTATTSPDDEVVKVETNLVTIPVSVYDRDGLYIPGLKKEDFKIFEDGKEQEIAYFGTDEKPFTVILMLDTSPSTAYKIEEIHAAASAFVDQLKPQDNVMVLEFNRSIRIRTEPTNDRDTIYKAIRKADFGEGTSLYDAVDVALRKKLSQIQGRKAVVLFTDGVDTTSVHKNYEETIDEAEESDALVFPIYFNTFFDNNVRVINSPLPGMGGIGGINGRGTSAGEYATGKQYLEDLATYTGGRVFRPESTPGGLTAAFEGIAEELRRQYNIGYVPKDEGKPGQRKEIRVRVDRSHLVVRSRDSYIVGTTTAPTTPSPADTKPAN